MFEPLTNHTLISIMLALLAFAILSDFQSRRIPNPLVLLGLVLGLAGHAWLFGFSGLLVSATGACVGLLCLLPFYISGGMGAGDVKLMAMCGSFLGPMHVATASAATLVFGGLSAMAWMLWQSSIAKAGQAGPIESDADTVTIRGLPATGPAIPFALAIGVGAVASIIAAPVVFTALEKGMS
jgi:prepilin peptidase CpaA